MPESGLPHRETASLAPHVAVYLPCEALREYVTFYYFVTTDGPVSDFLYPEWGNVRFALSGEWRIAIAGSDPAPQIDALFGPTDRCSLFTTSGGRCAGLGLTPVGWRQFIGEDADTMRNGVRPLREELGVPAGEIHAALLADTSHEQGVTRFDEILSTLMAERPAAPAQMIAIDRALRDRPISVRELAAAVTMSPRTLQRLCLKLYGFAPKRLLRRQRFMDTLGKIRTAVGEQLHDVLDAEYFDQAHFYRDFRTFMGMSPRAYFNASRAVMARAARAQEAAGVTLSFKLPPTSSRQGARLNRTVQEDANLDRGR